MGSDPERSLTYVFVKESHLNLFKAALIQPGVDPQAGKHNNKLGVEKVMLHISLACLQVLKYTLQSYTKLQCWWFPVVAEQAWLLCYDFKNDGQ